MFSQICPPNFLVTYIAQSFDLTWSLIPRKLGGTPQFWSFSVRFSSQNRPPGSTASGQQPSLQLHSQASLTDHCRQTQYSTADSEEPPARPGCSTDHSTERPDSTMSQSRLTWVNTSVSLWVSSLRTEPTSTASTDYRDSGQYNVNICVTEYVKLSVSDQQSDVSSDSVIPLSEKRKLIYYLL